MISKTLCSTPGALLVSTQLFLVNSREYRPFSKSCLQVSVHQVDERVVVDKKKTA